MSALQISDSHKDSCLSVGAYESRDTQNSFGIPFERNSLAAWIFLNGVFPYLGQKELDAASLTCKCLSVLSRDRLSIRAQEIRRVFDGADPLPATGITCPGPESSAREVHHFFIRLLCRLKEIDAAFRAWGEEQFCSHPNVEGMLFKVDVCALKTFLGSAYQFSQERVRKAICEDREMNKLGQSIDSVVSVLTTAQVTRLSECRKLFCIPNELREQKNLRALDVRGGSIDSIPVWLCQMTNLEELNLDDNPVIRMPRELKKLDQMTRPATVLPGFDDSPFSYRIQSKILVVSHQIFKNSGLAQAVVTMTQLPLRFVGVLCCSPMVAYRNIRDRRDFAGTVAAITPLFFHVQALGVIYHQLKILASGEPYGEVSPYFKMVVSVMVCVTITALSRRAVKHL